MQSDEKLSYHVPAAKLLKGTLLKAKKGKGSQISSSFKMLKRYLDLHENFQALKPPELEELSREDYEYMNTCKCNISQQSCQILTQLQKMAR